MIYKLGFKPAGSGMGVGAEVTTAAESAQCIYLAVAQEKLNTTYPAIIKDVTKADKYFRINDSPVQLMKKLPRQWQLSCERTSQYMTKSLFTTTRKYVFHRASPMVGKIEQKFNELNKTLDSGSRFSQKDKWNPSDIWAIKTGFIPSMVSIKTMEELNDYLRKEMANENLFGISLKLTIQPKLEYVNFGTTNKPKYSYKRFAVSLQGKNILTSKSCHIYIDNSGTENKIELRSHKALASWNAELAGTTANHGKMSYDRLAHLIRSITGLSLPTGIEIRNRAISHDKLLVKQIWLLAVKLGNPIITEAQYIEGMKNKNEDWVWSRFLGLTILDVISRTSPSNRDRIIDGFVSHAASQSDLSAPFLKVS